MTGKYQRIIRVINIIAFVTIMFSACVPETDSMQQEVEAPLTYTFYDGLSFRPLEWHEPNEDDVVNNYVEERFNIKVTDIYYNRGLSFRERFNQLLANDELPDVITVQAENSSWVANTGFYAEVGPLIETHMPNLLKWCPKEEWNDALIEGKLYGIPNPWIDTSKEAYASDKYTEHSANWTMIVREDILSALGYSYIPMAELRVTINESQTKLMSEDLTLAPAIDTPERLLDFLREVKRYGIESGHEDIIPLSIPWWLQGHFGNMFGMSNGWHYDSVYKDIHSYLGDPLAEDYYRFMNQLYREGLLDYEMFSQEDSHLEHKWASGSVAAGMWFSDASGIQPQLLKRSETDYLRPIVLPTADGIEPAGIDHYSPTTFQTFIRKDFEDIPRLMAYFDWMLSEEGLDILTWGPESSGLWTVVDGKKVFSDQSMWEAYKTGMPDEKRPDRFGIGYDSSNSIYPSRVVGTGISLRGYNPSSIERSYPIHSSINEFYSLSYATLSTGNLDRQGYVKEGMDALTVGPTNYMWDEFYPQRSILLIMASTEEEFEKNWTIIYDEFMTVTNYEASKKEMIKRYREAGFEIIEY